MKISILYFSKTGHTKEMANVIADGIRKVPNIEVGVFALDSIDDNFLLDSKAVIFGTPTYYANTCWQIKKWFDESNKYNLEGKIGAVFSTAHYAQGGADTAILTIINHLMVKGMLVYSGGSALGKPFIHLGAVAIDENFEESKSMFSIFGERIALKAKELFN
ncbi:flavodoxin [Clostridium sartagoforme AAU1]|uniref:Flavodoxin n=1 Tax=Clostridium sartagoforme AAU1 TaxID=1202534 RepID=R9CAN9_9CLOT|nr:flavodoxin domain-containing protein [Clostridium sartagoforme]EOR26362.1 flavodoxin [Clostridium sartagoforme AAU1]